MKLSTPEQESAFVGWLAISDLATVEAAGLCPGDEFTDDRWRPIYAAALRVRSAGRVVNRFSINDEIRALGVSPDFEKLFPTGWENWPDIADSSIAFSGPSVAASCLEAIHECAVRRAAAKLGKDLADGTIDVSAAVEQLRGIQDSARGESIASLLTARRFDISKPPKPATPIYELAGKTIATPGNLQAIIAKPKVGKSGVVGAFMAASTGKDGDTLKINSHNPEGWALIHFDTEQSPFDHFMNVMAGLARVKIPTAPAWLRSYHIFDRPISQRLAMLEHEMKAASREHGGIHSVLLDGVADLIADPNDPEQAFGLVERLHALAGQYATTIISVLHINPSSETNKTRGHLGSHLERKAETNLVLEKGEDGVCLMYSTNSRHAHVSKTDGPRFKWDDAKGMHVSVESAREERSVEINERMRTYAEEVFRDGALKYVLARKAIMQVAAVKETRAEVILKDLVKAGLVTKDSAGFYGLNR